MPEVEMFWIDLETTGLDANWDVPLEMAVVLTDKHGNTIDSWDTLVWDDGERQYQDAWNEMPDIVKAMHQQSGLTAALNDPHGDAPLSRQEVDRMVVNWLARHGVEPFTLPMSGSSVGSLDRPFVIQHFPSLNKFLHYRNIDISSTKEIVRMHRPALLEDAEAELGTKADSFHRALQDTLASIKEYQFYLRHFYRVMST